MVAPTANRIFPLKLADAGHRLAGSASSGDMARLAELARVPSGQVAYELEFGVNEHERPSASGRIETDVVLTCQRCTGEFGVHLSLPIAVEFVTDADEEPRQDGFETLLVQGATHLVEWMETELLMALPFAPVHEDGQCVIDERYALTTADEERPAPFAGLKDLLSNQ
jgi:uncharacterized protein